MTQHSLDGEPVESTVPDDVVEIVWRFNGENREFVTDFESLVQTDRGLEVHRPNGNVSYWSDAEIVAVGEIARERYRDAHDE